MYYKQEQQKPPCNFHLTRKGEFNSPQKTTTVGVVAKIKGKIMVGGGRTDSGEGVRYLRANAAVIACQMRRNALGAAMPNNYYPPPLSPLLHRTTLSVTVPFTLSLHCGACQLGT